MCIHTTHTHKHTQQSTVGGVAKALTLKPGKRPLPRHRIPSKLPVPAPSECPQITRGQPGRSSRAFVTMARHRSSIFTAAAQMPEMKKETMYPPKRPMYPQKRPMYPPRCLRKRATAQT